MMPAFKKYVVLCEVLDPLLVNERGERLLWKTQTKAQDCWCSSSLRPRNWTAQLTSSFCGLTSTSQ